MSKIPKSLKSWSICYSTPDPHGPRKRDRVTAWIRNKSTDAKKSYKDPKELQEMRRKLQNVVDEFTVSGSLALEVARVEKLFMHTQVSTLLRNEMISCDHPARAKPETKEIVSVASTNAFASEASQNGGGTQCGRACTVDRYNKSD
jgi:hypothetical protein